MLSRVNTMKECKVKAGCGGKTGIKGSEMDILINKMMFPVKPKVEKKFMI